MGELAMMIMITTINPLPAIPGSGTIEQQLPQDRSMVIYTKYMYVDKAKAT